jgi:pSer/pThr/pTyr-binding forkhead associated (FHA) protein
MSIWLVMQANDGRQRQFAVKANTIIGREPACDVRVPLPSVSLKHCQLVLDGDRVKLVDLRSDHGTFHNGNRVTEAVLSPDDTLTVGPVTFTVRLQHDAAANNGHAPEIVIERHEGLNGQLNGKVDSNVNSLHVGISMPPSMEHNTTSP